ncbi:MAG: DsbE family thiol:disulfide interchange protein [Alphaproteobacteria bacterium]|nr:DsbE family thiol:disulfide interchange protein [Alphaproteobacteria bacterium]
MRRLAYLLPVLLFAVVALFFLKGLGLNPREVPSPLIDKPAPALTLPLLKGDGQFTLAELKGRVTLINFFASWCVPCLSEHPLLMEMSKKGTLDIVGVAYKDKPEASLAWLARHGDPYRRIAADNDGRTAIDWGVYGVPESYLVDGEGRIRFKQVGPLTREVLEKTVLPMVKELRK